MFDSSLVDRRAIGVEKSLRGWASTIVASHDSEVASAGMPAIDDRPVCLC